MKSIIQFFEENVEKYSIMFTCGRSYTINMKVLLYSETRKQVHEFAAGLLQLGLKKVTVSACYPKDVTAGLLENLVCFI